VTRDRLSGVWLRFYRHGVMVNEWKSPGVPRCEWPENRSELKKIEADKAAALQGAEEAAKSPGAAVAPPKPDVSPPSKQEKPPVPKTDEKDELPEELKIFELVE